MALNFPGPYEVRLFYTTNLITVPLQHQARYNVYVDGDPDPGTAFADIDVIRRDGSPFALDGEVDDWVDLMKGLYNSTAGIGVIDYAELWKYEPESFDASYISTYPIAVTGTSATAQSPYTQVIVTFRTNLGGIMKISFLETIITQGAVDTLPFANATLDAMADALVAGTVPWVGRDGGYPFACIAAYPGQNEALFKKRVRP